MTRAPKAVREFLRKIGKQANIARNKKLTPQRRQEIARKAARARWAKRKKSQE